MSDQEYGLYSGGALASELEESIPHLRALGAVELAWTLQQAVEVLLLQHNFMIDKRGESELRIELEHQLAVVRRWENISEQQLAIIDQLKKGLLANAVSAQGRSQ